MTDVPIHQSDHARTYCSNAVETLGRDSNALKIAIVVSDDGFDVATYSLQGGNQNRLASMTSSLQALGDAAAKEMNISQCDYMLIESTDGYILMRRIPKVPLVLCSVFSQAETVGKAIFATKECAHKISNGLKEEFA